MGGSSLAPEVIRRTFAAEHVHVLDTTHPRAIRALEDSLDLERTLFVVSSKSGTTLETAEPPGVLLGEDEATARASRRSPTRARRSSASPGARLSRRLPGRADDRRALLGALGVRARPGGARRASTSSGSSSGHSRWPRPAGSTRAIPASSSASGSDAAGRTAETRSDRPESGRLRPLGGAAHRGVDRQGGQGARSGPGRAGRGPRSPA